MRSFLKTIFLFVCITVASQRSHAQFLLSGTVYDSTKVNLVEGVRVVSTGGQFGMTDSMGRYHLVVKEKDSVYFVFRGKPTPRYPITTVTDPNRFDISLHITVKGKYSTLKEVIVRTKTYRQDSLENRQTYADVFNYQKPGLRTNMSDGVVGADLDELINIFRFKRNRQLRAFQKRLEAQEEEKYVNYRFSKYTVHRITQLEGPQLDTFLIRYRPSYEFTANSNEVSFNEYVLNSYYKYKMYLMKMEAIKNGH